MRGGALRARGRRARWHVELGGAGGRDHALVVVDGYSGAILHARLRGPRGPYAPAPPPPYQGPPPGPPPAGPPDQGPASRSAPPPPAQGAPPAPEQPPPSPSGTPGPTPAPPPG